MTGKLFIDSTIVNTIKMTLVFRNKRYTKVRTSVIFKSQTILPLIDEMTKEHGLKLSDIKEITVTTDRGTFTGLRVAATIANTLAALLDIPVNGKTDLVIPTYS